MSADQPDGNATGVIAVREAEDIRSLPLGGNFARMITDVFTAAARRGAGGNPFEVAVRAYLSRSPGTPHDAAARAVADIICCRS